MIRHVLSHALAAGLAGLLFAAPAAADSASGQFVLDGKALKTDHAVAFRKREFSDARSFSTNVLLTAKPLDRAAIAAEIDPHSAALRDEALSGNEGFVTLSVAADGKVTMNAMVGGVQYIDSSGEIMGGPGSLQADCSTNTDKRVACSVKTKAPVKSFDGPTWTLEVSFDTEILSRPAGKPLGKDGGEPGKAFGALVAASTGDDLGKILAGLAPDNAQMFESEYSTPEDNLSRVKQWFEWNLPAKPKVTGGEITDDTALLEVESQPDPDSRMLYLVAMERHGGRWGFKSAQVLGMLK